MVSEIRSENLQQALDDYTKGTKAYWFREKEEEWISVTVASKHQDNADVEIVFQNDDDDRQEYIFKDKLAKLHHDKLPPLRNPPELENTDDLTNLSHLNEPSVLNTIQTRYASKNIYTYSGIVLIAANPFARVQLYEPDIIQQYSGRRRGELDPHLFAIAEDAYRCMIREEKNQTIVVSGESGAGKTVSAKYIMRYFATADDKDAADKTSKGGEMTEVEEQILATNPIMEAFGNAKTTRNDNSSRFGKYIEIQFDKKANIVGAKIRTYLLERSRLIFQPETERNYHVFYQLCAGAPLNERNELGLKEWSNFHYLNQSGTGIVPNVNDVEEFELTQRSLSTIGVAVKEQWEIFRLLAALLHIGNINIEGRESATLDDKDPSLLKASELLGVKPSEFKKWIIAKQFVTRSDKIKKDLKPMEAVVVRDSVAKYIYSCLFDWLVDTINRSLSCLQVDTIATFIGVLDIYGFEHFKKNSFEQFCINYANEKLQQQFNQHVFKLEQEEYVKEGIDWEFIDFSDNQGCIEMIEAKMGVLSLLDEESRLPSGTDQGFCNKLYANFDKPEKNKYFTKPRFSNSAFTVVHYAHDVEYEAEGFIDKNKDTVPDEILDMLDKADSKFLVEMLKAATKASHSIHDAPVATVHSSKKPTLGYIFKQSLINLMSTIGDTNVHYIRCIKPNEAKAAWKFEQKMVLAQLRACGVLETIRISCAGYPSRWSVQDFADRYYALVNSKHWDPNLNPDLHALCKVIIEKCIDNTDKYRIGHTKIFFRAGQLASMEKLRADRWNECTVLLQKNMRRFILRRRYLRLKEIVGRLQQVARKKMAMRQLEIAKQTRGTIKIQSAWRGYVARKKYRQQRLFILMLQAMCRGRLARQHYAKIQEHKAATQIQCYVRGWLARRRLQSERRFIVSIQSLIRRRRARKELGALRVEARSASHFKEVSYQLENTVVDLNQQLKAQENETKAQKNENKELTLKASQLANQLASYKEKLDKLDAKAKQAELERTQKTAELEKLQQYNDTLQTQNKKLEEQLNTRDKQIDKLTSELEEQRNTSNELQGYKMSTVGQEKTIRANEVKIEELERQVARLKEQLAQKLKNQPKRQPSLNSYGRSISPSSRLRNLSPDVSRGRSPGSISDAPRRGSSVSVNLTDKVFYEEPDTMPPVFEDRAKKQSLGNGDEYKLQDDISNLLYDEEVLMEILEGLINSPAFPSPQMEQDGKVIYPAHIIGLWTLQMWHRKDFHNSEEFLFTAMSAIQNRCDVSVGESSRALCVFWLSNVYKLRSMICCREEELRAKAGDDWYTFEKLIGTVKYELGCLEENIYYHWMEELVKRLKAVAVSAMIEYQSPDGISAQKNTNRREASMSSLIGLLNDTNLAMQKYGLAPALKKQVFEEIHKHIGVIAFNDFVRRKGFSAWKRATSILENIGTLGDWYKRNELDTRENSLTHLHMAVKLILLCPGWAADQSIDEIKEIVHELNMRQVYKILADKSTAGYEKPVPAPILEKIQAEICDYHALQLDLPGVEEYEVPEPHDETNIYTDLPPSLNLGHLERLMKLIKRQDAL